MSKSSKMTDSRIGKSANCITGRIEMISIEDA
jgi:hypothetical protein